MRHVSQAKSGPFAAEGIGIAIRPAILNAVRDASVVTKQSADAFQENNLAQHLNGVSTPLVCGMMTQNCVVFTAMSRAADGFEVCVISDLCAAPTGMVHQIALNALRSKLLVRNATEIWPLAMSQKGGHYPLMVTVI